MTVEALDKLETDKGAWFVHRSTKPGALSADVLPAMVVETIQALPLGKPMRWGSNEFAFLRPVHGLIVLLGETVLPTQIYGIASGRRTRGHRFHHAGEVVIARPSEYIGALLAARVIVDPQARRERVRAEVSAAAIQQGGVARLPEDLIDEVSNLTEYPCAIACSIPTEFMRLPPAVIVTTIETHQRFFPVLDPAGALTPYFVGVANIESRDPNEIRKDYERVVRPALPQGMTLSRGRFLGGTPMQQDFAAFFSVTATDAQGAQGSRDYYWAIDPAVTVAPPTVPGGKVGQAYMQGLSANGGTAPYIFTMTAGELPPGISISTAGLLSGTPTTAGFYAFAVQATDARGLAGQTTYNVSIDGPALTISPTSLPDAKIGVNYRQRLTASGGTAPYTFALTDFR